MRCWQDYARTVPAVNEGDPVAVLETDDGRILYQPNHPSPPVIRNGRPFLDGAKPGHLPDQPAASDNSCYVQVLSQSGFDCDWPWPL